MHLYGAKQLMMQTGECRYNFQDLVENECKLPAEVQGMPPTILVGKSGTIVHIEIR